MFVSSLFVFCCCGCCCVLFVVFYFVYFVVCLYVVFQGGGRHFILKCSILQSCLTSTAVHYWVARARCKLSYSASQSTLPYGCVFTERTFHACITSQMMVRPCFTNILQSAKWRILDRERERERESEGVSQSSQKLI